MIVDSSAVVAVLLEEDGYQGLEEKMEEAGRVAIGAPTLFETEMVMLSALGDRGLSFVVDLRQRFDVEVVDFEGRHSRAATDAFSRFGKGRHPAALNYGDCMTYATARLAERPLLFKGDDFARTDIDAA